MTSCKEEGGGPYKQLHAGWTEVVLPFSSVVPWPAVSAVGLPLNADAIFVESPVVVVGKDGGQRLVWGHSFLWKISTIGRQA